MGRWMALVVGLAATVLVRAEAARNRTTKFDAAEGVAVTLAVAEPTIAQPVYLTFDERGRMWVVQYRQYPFPEGLKVVGHDMYWRVQYDHFPPPAPPHHVKGRDRVTILEDRDADGRFETAKDFVGELNIATAALPGLGGVWVMNPPYLLFYPDADQDDVPDADPVVHLAGFGLEDMHAVANSLMWGPDGWIYGCTGSTCTASITQPRLDVAPVRFTGQSIWRYEPKRKIFEVFAEGGYNNFGIAMDPAGRMFTGSNGGIIGVHYVQGGYYWKNFGKHGPHANPYSFGLLPSMPDKSSGAKLSQAMLWYENGALPSAYDGQLIVARVMQHRVDQCALTPQGSNFAAKEVGPILSTDDEQFRPIDLKLGPDGAVYVADWFDDNVTWQVSAEKQSTDRDSGRIYRLAKAGTPAFAPFDMAKEPTAELVALLLQGHAWQRQMALRLLRERGDGAAIAPLREALAKETGPRAVDALWGVNALGGLDAATIQIALTHQNPDVRRWAVRLLGDARSVDAPQADALQRVAQDDQDAEVRAQVASAARRLPGASALPLLQTLAAVPDGENDPFLPLLVWWGVEEKLRSDPQATRAWILGDAPWAAPLFAQAIAPRLGQRFTQDRSPEALAFAAKLLQRAPTPALRGALLSGMEQGLRGARVEAVPDELRAAVKALLIDAVPDGKLLNVAMRVGVPGMGGIAIEAAKDGQFSAEDRRAILQMLGEQREAKALPLLIALLRDGPSNDDRAAAIDGLQHYGNPEATTALLDAVPTLGTALGDKALGVLVSRSDSAERLFAKVDAGEIPPRRIALDLLTTARGLGDAEVDALLAKHYGNVRKSPEELAQRMKEVRDALDTAAGVGDAARGKVIFGETCAKCHVYFGEGRAVGPELTGVERSNREQLIQSIIDPSAAVLPEFLATVFTLRGATLDDPFGAERQVVGFLLQETEQSVTLIDSAGNEVTVPPNDLLSRAPMPLSLMPTGLLDALSPQQIRDLFVYLQRLEPLAP